MIVDEFKPVTWEKGGAQGGETTNMTCKQCVARVTTSFMAIDSSPEHVGLRQQFMPDELGRRKARKLLKLLPIIVASPTTSTCLHFAVSELYSLHLGDRVTQLGPVVHSAGSSVLASVAGGSFVCFFTQACRYP